MCKLRGAMKLRGNEKRGGVDPTFRNCKLEQSGKWRMAGGKNEKAK